MRLGGRFWKEGWLAAPITVAMLGIAASSCAPAVAAIRGCMDGRIAFDSLRDGSRDIYVMNPFSGGLGQPTPDPTPMRLTSGADDEKPSWSPPDNNLNNDCGNTKPYTRPPTMIAFQSTSQGDTNIYAIQAPTPEPAGQPVLGTPEPAGQPVPVTRDVGADTAPAWAPFAPAGAPKLLYPPIAFERTVNGNRDIFIANYNGTDETNLTNSSGADYANPDWSPGTASDLGLPPPTAWLTFDSNQGGRRAVWVMDVGYNASNGPDHGYVSLGMSQVTTGQPDSSNPSWFTFTNPFGNPGGAPFDRLAFAGPDQDGGPSQINVADSTTARTSTAPFPDPTSVDFSALTSGPTENAGPVWSPKGDFIAYQKTAVDGTSDIYVLAATSNDETGDVNLTPHVGDNKNPDWEAVEIETADVYPIRPLGRRHRKRHAQDTGPLVSPAVSPAVSPPVSPPVAHTLTASLSGSGEGVITGAGISCPPTCVHTYPDATTVSLLATAAPGSTFAGWAGAGCSATGPCTVSLSADGQVGATFNLVPPVLSALAIFPRKFTLTGRLVKRGCVPAIFHNPLQRVCARAIALRVSYRLSIPASLTLTLRQERTGRLVNAHCVAVTRTNETRRRCVRLIPVRGSLVRASAAGASRFTFNGVIGGRRMNTGSYRLTATPSANGNIGNAQTTSFKILW
jgi:hypothetical protein